VVIAVDAHVGKVVGGEGPPEAFGQATEAEHAGSGAGLFPDMVVDHVVVADDAGIDAAVEELEKWKALAVEREETIRDLRARLDNVISRG
jgi:hypothetical protein